MTQTSGLLIVFGLPLLTLTLVVSCIFWSSKRADRRFKRFAAVEGITYTWKPSPIELPPVVYEQYSKSTVYHKTNSIREANDFLYGPRHGVEVFACNFQVGWMRGNINFLFMVGVRAELHDISGLDLKRWRLIPFNEWTFLVPREPEGGTLNLGKIAALWDALTVAAQTKTR